MNEKWPDKWVCVFVGKVVSMSRWSDTHVSSSGGGGYVGQSGGYVSPPVVRSSVKQRLEVFVKDENGKEQSFDLSEPVDVSFREGSNLQIIWGSLRGGPGEFLYVENLDTQDRYQRRMSLSPPLSGVTLFFYLALCVAIGLLGAAVTSILVEMFSKYRFDEIFWNAGWLPGGIIAFVALILLGHRFLVRDIKECKELAQIFSTMLMEKGYKFQVKQNGKDSPSFFLEKLC